MDYTNLTNMGHETLLKTAFFGIQGVKCQELIPYFDRMIPVELWEDADSCGTERRYGMFIFKMNEHTGILCWSSGYIRGYSDGVGNLRLKTGEKKWKTFSPVGHMYGYEGDTAAEEDLTSKVFALCKEHGVHTLYKYGGGFMGGFSHECLTVKGGYGDLQEICNAEHTCYKNWYEEKAQVMPFLEIG